ncbi:MAG: DUF3857 domain-containing protein [Verrucomicrobia bacterium]|nr:DUF3857 domain-containing protein [Verrucomicrobiota bacterium]
MTPPFRTSLGVALLLFLVSVASAAPSALIVIGLTANETDAALWSRLADRTRLQLAARGIPADRITVLASAEGAPVTRERILASLTTTARDVGADDDCWLILFGHSAPARDSQPAFQVRGPRLTATDLQSALAAIAGHSLVVLNTSQSGGYLPFLKNLPNCTAIAATAGIGETGVPRFPEIWVDALAETPAAPFTTLAARAAERVDAFYTTNGLAQVESARLLAGPDREILSAPFGVTAASAPAAVSASPSAAPVLTSADIEIPTTTGDSEFSPAPATDATRSLLAEAARLAPQADGHSALVLQQEIALTLNADRTSTRSTRLRVLLLTPAAIAEWADYTFVHQPPTETTRIEGARLILPDASALVLNPRRLADNTPVSSELPVPLHLNLPQAAPGCIVELAWTTELRAAYDLPEFYDELELARSAPVVATVLTLRLPKTGTFNHQLRNLPAAPAPVESATEHSRVLAWTLPALPAYEPLPYDPPRRDLVATLAVSSLPSWEAFDTWFRRIARGSDEIGPSVRARAAEITRLNPTPETRIRAAYEFVSSLRYVAIEFGIHAFRPRTPDTVLRNRYGDCKDKANLLIALLHAMDLPAEFVLLNRGSSTDPAFPGWQFNHAIAHIPAFADQPERWLDATDGTTRFGVISPGDLGRQARILPPTGEARFAPVRLGAEITAVTDTWTFETHTHGAWLGRVERRFTGLADYELRQQLGNASPALRAFALHQQLAALLPDATFENVTLTNLDDLAQPVGLTATFYVLAASPAPRPASTLAAALAAPTRDRPIALNDGQPLRYTQIVRRVTTGSETAPDLEDDPPHAPMRIGENTLTQSFSRPDDHTVLNTAVLDLNTPFVSSSDYPAFVQAFRIWRELAAIPVDHHPFSKP